MLTFATTFLSKSNTAIVLSCSDYDANTLWGIKTHQNCSPCNCNDKAIQCRYISTGTPLSLLRAAKSVWAPDCSTGVFNLLQRNINVQFIGVNFIDMPTYVNYDINSTIVICVEAVAVTKSGYNIYADDIYVDWAWLIYITYITWAWKSMLLYMLLCHCRRFGNIGVQGIEAGVTVW